MSAVIWKYKLPTRGSITVPMPKNAKILSVNNRKNKVTLWAVVDDRATTITERRFYVAATGDILDGRVKPKDTFIGTVMFNGGDYVAHVFEVLS